MINRESKWIGEEMPESSDSNLKLEKDTGGLGG